MAKRRSIRWSSIELITRLNLGELLHDCATRYGDRPFVTMAESEQTVTYRQFEELTNRLAHGIVDRFGKTSDYMSIMLENSIEYLAASYAMKKAGIVEISVNRAFLGAALARMINLNGARVLFSSDAHLDALDQIREQISHVRTLVMVGGSNRGRALFPELEVLDFDDLLSPRSGHMRSTAEGADIASILFTSGTTGVSKGCLLSHRYAIRTAENVIGPFRVTAEDCVYSPYPLSHIGPAYYDVLPSLMVGARVILRECFSVSAFWPEVKRLGVTWFMMLGSVQQRLWAAPPCPEETEHSVTRCWGTPAPVPKAEFDARFGLHLIPGGGYGSTDAGWVVAPQWDHAGGVVLPHYEVKIVDEEGTLVPPGTPGELLVQAKEAGVMADGYAGMPDETAECWRDGWLHTGDVARLDREGRFYFLHRVSERIRVRGEMVSAIEIEEGVLAHPDVEDCAAVGIPSELGEEDIRLFVVPKPHALLSSDEMRQYCARRMAKFMVPRDILFVDDLPRTPTGKTEKGKLATLEPQRSL